ncbi:hypothetical protein JHK82_039397 [Glycine max]|nr:hypothetical protein JHK86_039576 [Glycine max]KAG5110174.1 hypothetical protein JHK82_039397 [Glycine max]KAG5121461.1 hypothetical protein JHK84_039801 [Glycine max]
MHVCYIGEFYLGYCRRPKTSFLISVLKAQEEKRGSNTNIKMDEATREKTTYKRITCEEKSVTPNEEMRKRLQKIN